jgi:hypothetical protein
VAVPAFPAFLRAVRVGALGGVLARVGRGFLGLDARNRIEPATEQPTRTALTAIVTGDVAGPPLRDQDASRSTPLGVAVDRFWSSYSGISAVVGTIAVRCRASARMQARHGVASYGRNR